MEGEQAIQQPQDAAASTVAAPASTPSGNGNLRRIQPGMKPVLSNVQAESTRTIIPIEVAPPATEPVAVETAPEVEPVAVVETSVTPVTAAPPVAATPVATETSTTTPAPKPAINKLLESLEEEVVIPAATPAQAAVDPVATTPTKIKYKDREFSLDEVPVELEKWEKDLTAANERLSKYSKFTPDHEILIDALQNGRENEIIGAFQAKNQSWIPKLVDNKWVGPTDEDVVRTFIGSQMQTARSQAEYDALQKELEASIQVLNDPDSDPFQRRTVKDSADRYRAQLEQTRKDYVQGVLGNYKLSTPAAAPEDQVEQELARKAAQIEANKKAQERSFANVDAWAANNQSLLGKFLDEQTTKAMTTLVKNKIASLPNLNFTHAFVTVGADGKVELDPHFSDKVAMLALMDKPGRFENFIESLVEARLSEASAQNSIETVAELAGKQPVRNNETGGGAQPQPQAAPKPPVQQQQTFGQPYVPRNIKPVLSNVRAIG